jgi:membrane-bound serine protease (ClpP class)
LISIACDSIYMARGSSIGAATVVIGDGTAAPDKYQSYMRSTMRTTAEVTGRDPAIAEAMVDQDIEIEGVTKAGNVLTFSVSEAIANGFCEAEVNSIEEIMERNGIDDFTIDRFQVGTVEKIIAVFLNPFISGILLLVIVGGIYFELQSPGVGFPIVASVIAMTLYFVPYYLNGMAENWEILAFMIGIALIMVEVFVVPGFGIFGISGIIITLGSLILSMLNNDVFDFSFVGADEVFIAITTALAGIFGAILVLFVGGARMTQSKFFSRIALVAVQKSDDGYTSSSLPKGMVGKKGTAYTILRPSGRVMIENDLYDAFTRGGFVKKGEEILVISSEGTSLKVKPVKD